MSQDATPAHALAAVLVCMACCQALAPGLGSADPPRGLRLMWSDEFNTDGRPSEEDWAHERGFVRNRELQWYQRDNAFCEDGCLVIEARRERKDNPLFGSDSRRVSDWAARREHIEYTSASLTTRGKHQWRYGRLEVRGKIPTDPGAWPAIWTLGVRGGWPGGGEVDVMEYYRGKLLANLAWGAQWREVVWRTESVPLATFPAGWHNQFHVWRMDWDEHEIRLTVDDRLLNKVSTDEASARRDSDPHPFRQPHYLLLNLAIGGTQGGDPAGAEFPIRYLVDYARIYQFEEADHEDVREQP